MCVCVCVCVCGLNLLMSKPEGDKRCSAVCVCYEYVVVLMWLREKASCVSSGVKRREVFVSSASNKQTKTMWTF